MYPHPTHEALAMLRKSAFDVYVNVTTTREHGMMGERISYSACIVEGDGTVSSGTASSPEDAAREAIEQYGKDHRLTQLQAQAEKLGYSLTKNVEVSDRS
jgi:hypothetical protein